MRQILLTPLDKIFIVSVITSISIYLIISYYIHNILSFISWVTNEINRPTFFSVNIENRILIALFPISALIGCIRLKSRKIKSLFFCIFSNYILLIVFLILSFNIVDIVYDAPSAPSNYVCQVNEWTLTVILFCSLLLSHIINYQIFRLIRNKNGLT